MGIVLVLYLSCLTTEGGHQQRVVTNLESVRERLCMYVVTLLAHNIHTALAERSHVHFILTLQAAAATTGYRPYETVHPSCRTLTSKSDAADPWQGTQCQDFDLLTTTKGSKWSSRRLISALVMNLSSMTHVLLQVSSRKLSSSCCGLRPPSTPCHPDSEHSNQWSQSIVEQFNQW
jgi:hypothetical protein